ncbi:hypothetical protein GOV04_01500 [Candidatus Woesearchaeota archaeon]|nr:hypothetical protein [Candidatus Woesearchaeota archaeon]
MVTEYHKRIEDELLKYGQELVLNKKIRKVYQGNKSPLSIVDPKTKMIVNYQPDIYFILKNNKKLIIEILDSEEKKQDIIIADIIRSILVENVNTIAFIFPGDIKDEQTIIAALKTIYKGLTHLGIKLKDLPDDKKTGPYSITRTIAGNKVRLKEKIREYFP